MRERETQELLKSCVMASGSRKGTASGTRRGTMGSPAFNKALAQNVAAEKVQMYGQVGPRAAAVGSGAQQQGCAQALGAGPAWTALGGWRHAQRGPAEVCKPQVCRITLHPLTCAPALPLHLPRPLRRSSWPPGLRKSTSW